MPQPLLEAIHITKRYGAQTAVDDVTFRLDAGVIFGYLGQNGAGKTTTIRILLGLIRPDAGEVRIEGFTPFQQPVEVFRRVGYCPEIPSLQGFMTGLELLQFTGRLCGLSSAASRVRARELVELVGLWDHRDKKIGKYSKGMVQRLAVAQALVHDPELLVMDEPTLGMDPAATVHFRDLFHSLGKQGKGVFISSHMLDEVQRLCSHVAMIHRGRLVFNGTVPEMLQSFEDYPEIEVELKEVAPRMVEALRRLDRLRDVKVEGNRLTLAFEDRSDHREEVSTALVREGAVILGLTMRRRTLEDAYLQALRSEGPA